jgi:hypothetical protein
MSLNEKGIRAAYMNIHGTEVYSFNNESIDDEVDYSLTKSGMINIHVLAMVTE